MSKIDERIDTGRFKRKTDSGPDHEIWVDLEGDGDALLWVFSTDPMNEKQQTEAVIEFCNTGAGRGRSPNTLRALYQLAEAIKKDNKEFPI